MEKINGKIALICEGVSEVTLMNILLDGDKFWFPREQLIEERILKNSYYRNPKLFASDYLNMNYEDGLNVFLIHDNSRNYNIPKPFDIKINRKCQFITEPEIEMILVHHHNLYSEYEKSKLKPSLFLANTLKTKSSVLKGAKYLQSTFSADDLVKAIKMYAQKSKSTKVRRDEFRLAELLKS